MGRNAWITSLLVLSLVFTGVATRAETWALIVGVNTYGSAEPLTCAVNDAREFYGVLVDPALGCTDKSHVRLLTDESVRPTRAAIIKALDEVSSSVKPGDRLIFFFTGHGVCIGSRTYLVPIDGQAGESPVVESTCLSAEDITRRISGSGASEVLLFIDACRNKAETTKGAGGTGDALTEQFAKAFVVKPRVGGAKMTATLFGCSLGQSAYEWPEMKHGVFTYFCIQGYRGAFPHSAEGVTLSDLQQYVGNEVARHRQQYPQHAQTPWIVVDGQAGSLVLSHVAGAQSPPPSFPGRVSVSFPGDEDCKAKAALIDALIEQNLDVVDATDRAGREDSGAARVRIIGKQRSERRSTNTYGVTIRTLDTIVSIKIVDAKAGKSLGTTEATGSVPLIGPETARERDAADRAAEQLRIYVLNCLQRASP